MADSQSINGIQITQAQMKELEKKGYDADKLKNLSAGQLSSLLNGKPVNNSLTGGFGNLSTSGKVAKDNTLSQMLSGGGGLSRVGTYSSQPEVVNLDEIRTQKGGYNFAAVDVSGMTPREQKSVQKTSSEVMAASAVAASNAPKDTVLSQQALGMVKTSLTPSEKESNSVVVDADNGIPAVNTGLFEGIGNAENIINSTGKVTPEVKKQVSSARESLNTLDTQISDLEKKVDQLGKLETTAGKAVTQMSEDSKKITDSTDQQKIEQYQNIASQYTDTQATAEKLKGDYELTPDTVTDKNGNNITNPKKEEIRRQYEEKQKEANNLKQQCDTMKEKMSNNSQLASITDQTDNICNFYSNYGIKKGDLQNKKEFRAALAAKTSNLDKMIAQKSGGTSTD